MAIFNNIQSGSSADFEARPPVPAFAALVLLWTILTLAGLRIAPLFDYDEASYAQTAVELANKGHWLLPILNNQPYYDKPAFVYYCMDASFALFGRNAFAARLPSVLFTLATALLLFHLGRRMRRPAMGMTASLIYLSMLMPALLAHAAILDAALNFFIAAAVLYFFLWQREGRRGDAFLSMLATGIAVSVKGPVGMVVPAVVIGLDRLLASDFVSCLRRFPWSIGLPAFFLGALPWYALVTFSYGFDFLRQFVFRENVLRFTHPFEGHSGSWYYYLAVFIPSALPWTVWIPWWVKRMIERKKEKETPDGLSRLCLVWTGIVILLFSLASTKLPHYIASVYPSVALGLAAAWRWQSPTSAWTRGASLVLLALCVPLLLGLLLLLLMQVYYPHLAFLFMRPGAATLFSPDLPSQRILLAGVFIAASLALLLALVNRVRLAALPLLFVLFGFIVQTSLVWTFAPFAGNILQGPAMKIAEQIRKSPAEEPVYTLVNRPSIAFYSRRSFIDAGRVDLSKRFETSTAPFLLIASTSQLPELYRRPLKLVLRAGDYALLRYVPRKGRS